MFFYTTYVIQNELIKNVKGNEDINNNTLILYKITLWNLYDTTIT